MTVKDRLRMFLAAALVLSGVAIGPGCAASDGMIEKLYDSTRAWRDRAMRGRYHSGSLVRDRRSRNHTAL